MEFSKKYMSNLDRTGENDVLYDVLTDVLEILEERPITVEIIETLFLQYTSPDHCSHDCQIYSEGECSYCKKMICEKCGKRWCFFGGCDKSACRDCFVSQKWIEYDTRMEDYNRVCGLCPEHSDKKPCSFCYSDPCNDSHDCCGCARTWS